MDILTALKVKTGETPVELVCGYNRAGWDGSRWVVWNGSTTKVTKHLSEDAAIEELRKP